MSAMLLAATAGTSAVVANDNVRTIRASSDASTASGQHLYTQQRGSHSSSSTEFAGGAWARLRNTRRRRSGYGWTNAHQKRVATKARNVKRHRAAQKG